MKLDVLRERAADFAASMVVSVRREFPNEMLIAMRRPGDHPYRPREVHPAFYGCYDWHSAVQLHWALVRLLRTVPDSVPQHDIRALLAEHLTAPALATESSTIAHRDRVAFPYALGWALTLIHELATWDDSEAQQWAANARQLADVVAGMLASWLPKSAYPIRNGLHSNTAWGMSLSLPYARMRAADGDPVLLDAITDAAHRWYGNDADYPADWEPSGTDFLSPALCEAELMANVLPKAEFAAWFDRFLPQAADGGQTALPTALRTPVITSDDTNGQLAHLHGVNLSRAVCWSRIADALPADDPRVAGMRATAEEHAERELDNVTGGDYFVEHWLASYAVLYLSGSVSER